MRKKILFILIFLLAFVLRFYKLAANPPSLDWDEVSLGYNAYSILKTGKDEYGNFLPLSIRSFNDYKPPLYTYLTIIPVYLFGLNEFSTRFTSALFGTLAVVAVYLLVEELFGGISQNKKLTTCYLLLTTFFFSISPWHIQFSRVAFEANLALFFFILGAWLFVRGVGAKARIISEASTAGVRQLADSTPPACLELLLSFFSFALSCYAYHSPRLVVPIFLFGLLFIFRREIQKKLLCFLMGTLLLGLMLFPLFNQFRTTGARLSSVTVVNPNEILGPSIKAIELDEKRGDALGRLLHNRRVVYAREILAGYLDHFNFDFLFLVGDASGRHHSVGMGMLYFWDLLFVFIGIAYLMKNLGQNVYFVIFWFLVAPVSSALTKATPHAVRSLLFLPIYQIFAAFGLIQFLKWRRKKNKGLLSNTLSIFAILFLIFNFFYYLHMYWVHTPYEEASEWQYGYKQVVKEVEKIDRIYDKIIVTYHYDQPYVYFLFYKKIDPSWYQENWGSGEIKRDERKFGKYEFRRIDWSKDSRLTNALLVGSPKEIPQDTSGFIKDIKFPDGMVAFRIVER